MHLFTSNKLIHIPYKGIYIFFLGGFGNLILNSLSNDVSFIEKHLILKCHIKVSSDVLLFFQSRLISLRYS